MRLLFLPSVFFIIVSTALASGVPAPRIVFLGDSITDGHTYPQLVQQALQQAGKPVPVVINAGSGGDLAQGMSARLERDVLAHKPTLVTLHVGANDALRGITLGEYSRAVTSIADRLKAEQIPLVLLTTATYGAKHAAAEKTLDAYNDFLRRFAAERNLKLADVNALFRKAREEKGESAILEADGVHPNLEGQRLLARAVLDALGFPDAPVPQNLKLGVMPGVLPSWHFLAVPEDKAIDDAAVKALTKQVLDDANALATWKEYSLPETQPQEHPWMEHERQRGFGLSLDKLVGAGKLWRGVALLDNKSGKAENVFINTGAQLRGVWLGGERIYEKDWRGWHAGRDRIPAVLNPGRNVLLIETAGPFFLSVTDSNDW